MHQAAVGQPPRQLMRDRTAGQPTPPILTICCHGSVHSGHCVHCRSHAGSSLAALPCRRLLPCSSPPFCRCCCLLGCWLLGLLRPLQLLPLQVFSPPPQRLLIITHVLQPSNRRHGRPAGRRFHMAPHLRQLPSSGRNSLCSNSRCSNERAKHQAMLAPVDPASAPPRCSQPRHPPA